MFNNISKKFIKIIQNISGFGRITEKDIQQTIREIRKTLLEADVSLLVIQELIEKIKKKIIGQNINHSLTPGQEVIKILKEEIITIIGSKNNELNFSIKPPAIFLIVGMQGSGKTTSVMKLAKWIQNKYKKKILVSSTDIYRPAAIKQLNILSNENKIDFFESQNHENTIIISQDAMLTAKKKLYDILILDTAGRLHINKEMMYEIYQIQEKVKPIEILFVIDAMTGQDAINIAKKFNQFVNITGIILTKIDSDTRSGSALSASYITQKPIKFVGTGEQIKSFEMFNPENIASKILGMNDVFSIISNIEKNIKKENIKKIQDRIKKKNKFNFYDFKSQIQQIEKIGGIDNILSLLPKNNTYIKNFQSTGNKKYLIKIEAMIHSMTPYERMNPEIIKGSRKKRIARGSGHNIQDINKLLKQFYEFKNIMKKMKQNGIHKTIKYFKNIMPKIF